MKGKRERERYIQLNAEFQRIARRDKKAFLSEQRKQRKTIEWKRLESFKKFIFSISFNLFKIIGDIKGIFRVRMDTIKDRNEKDLTEVEEIKKRWQEYTERPIQKRS